MVDRIDATHAGTTAEPASALLRRLDREATPGPWMTIEKQKTYGDKSYLVHNANGWAIAETPALSPLNGAGVRDTALITALRNALPALADLVEATEALGCHECGRSRIVAGKPCGAPLCRSLAAVRAALAAKP